MKYYLLGDVAYPESTLIGAGVERRSPVVVIDPENRAQIERLRDLWGAAVDDQVGVSIPSAGDLANALQAALREFADPTPPKPAEPLGLGAVVEAINDNRFVRVGAAGWVHERNANGSPCDWDDIAAVRVLSEGWSA